MRGAARNARDLCRSADSIGPDRRSGTKPIEAGRRTKEQTGRERVVHRVGSDSMGEQHKDGQTRTRTFRSRWVPVAITILAVASVAAEIWGVVRGLSLMMTR
jgi:hypothetical protein